MWWGANAPGSALTATAMSTTGSKVAKVADASDAEHYIAPHFAARGMGFLGWNTRFRGAEDLFVLEHALIDTA